MGEEEGELNLQDELEALLSEGIDGATLREATTYDQFAGYHAKSIVLFGAGGLGRRTMAGLWKQQILPVAFVDNSGRFQAVDGIPVFSPETAAQRFGQGTTFVVTIWGALGKDRMRDRIRQLQNLGCARVISFGPLAWKYPEGILPHYGADLPHHVHEQTDAVRQCFDLWADDASRREYLNQTRWRLFMDFDCLSDPVGHPTYFPKDLCALRDDEAFLDCGAYDGDTLRVFMEETGGRFGSFRGFEPDPANFETFRKSAGSYGDHRLVLYQSAVGSERARVKMAATGTPSSTVGEGDCEVDSVTIDGLDSRVTYLKMDIEGAELDALAGAAETIRQQKPVLAISCYHRQDHLWKIPLLINSLSEDYSLFLRPHDIEMWDLVCYAIPKERLARD